MDANVLKVAHHGSRGSSSDAFLDAVTPMPAVISVGASNSHDHPSPEVLDRLQNHGAHVLRTDVHGTVTVRTFGTETIMAVRQALYLPCVTTTQR